MTKKLFVGNLNFTITANNLINAFSDFGNVQDVKLIMDHITNRSKGFAFVEMADACEAQKAIASLNGFEMEGRNIIVSVAKENEQRNKRLNSRW